MGKFIDEVAKINQNNNHKYKISEEKENVKNALFKRFLKEFRNTEEDFEDVYSILSQIDTMKKICFNDFDFGMHVTLEFIYTTYQKELNKVYKMFKQQQKTELEREKVCEERLEQKEQERLAPKEFLVVCDAKSRMMFDKTLENHIKNNIPIYEEKTEQGIIKHYNVYNDNNQNYDLKIYYNDIGTINYAVTYKKMSDDGFLDGIKTKSSSIIAVIIAILFIPPLLLFASYKILVLLIISFILGLIWLT